jgi:hypothetical protein
MKPIISNFRSTTYNRAFLLNAFVTAAIAVFAIEMRSQLQNVKGGVYGYFNEILAGKGLSEIQIMGIVFATTFLAAFIVYNLMYIIFHYGAGMIISDQKYSYL